MEAEFTEKPEASVLGEAARTKHETAASGAGRVAVETEGGAPAQGAKPWVSGLPLNFFQASAEELAPSGTRPGLALRALEWLVPPALKPAERGCLGAGPCDGSFSCTSAGDAAYPQGFGPCVEVRAERA